MLRLPLACALFLVGCGVALPANEEFLSEHDIRADVQDVAEGPDGLDVGDGDAATDVQDAADATATADVSDALDAEDAADAVDSPDTPAGSDTADAADSLDVPVGSDAADAADAADTVDASLDAASDASSDAALAEDATADSVDSAADDATTDAAGTDAAADDVPEVADDAAAGTDASTDTAADAADTGPDVPPTCEAALCPDDGNACTTAACNGDGACVQLPNAATCDDANACTSNDTCAASTCAGVAISCADGNACTDDTCLTSSGCSHTPLDGQPCSDSNLCTNGDGCVGAVCTPGTVTSCNDDNACTQDACAPATGCSHTPLDGQPCSDGNLCTNGDGCVGAVCTPGAVTSCNDDNACTQDACTPATGCSHTPLDGQPCSDGNLCTDGDSCVGTVCQPGDPVICAVSGACHLAGTCAPTTGVCSDPIALDGSPCSDGLACTTESCLAGACKKTLVVCAANATCGEPGGCACNSGYLAVAVDGTTYCAPDFPVWGARPLRPPATWFVDNSDGTVSDVQTGLLWQQAASPTTMYRKDALAYCDALSLAAHQDWRLPTLAELQTLVDYTRVGSALPTVFPATSAAFWSARTVAAPITDSSWFVQFDTALTSFSGGYTLANARCVRGNAKSLTGNRFATTTSTVVDAATGLTWQRDATTASSATLAVATSYCQGLSLAGGGWRLPTAVELFSLVDRGHVDPSADPIAFSATLNSGYITSTQTGDGASQWNISFHAGNSVPVALDNPWARVRCVKGTGACGLLGTSDCDDGSPCTIDTCDPAKGGCVHSAKCDDGNPCTLDVCGSAGICSFPAALFQQTYGGPKYDMGVGIDKLSDGYILTGKSNNSSDGTESVLLVRTDRAGNQLWSQTYGGAGYDGGLSVVARADGYAIGGYTTSKGAGGYDYWLLRTDLDGNLLWDKTFGDTATDQNYGMLGLSDGYLLNGMGAGAVTGNPQGWLVRTDLNGAKVWDHAYAVGIWDQANSVTPTSDGGYAFAGGTYAVPGGKSDAWLVRIDGSGNQVWSRTYGGSDNDVGWGVVNLADGFAVAGTTASSGAGDTDLWLIRMDLQGNKLWDRTYGGTGAEAGGPIALLADGFALGGYTVVNGTNIGYVVRTNLAGNLVWQKTYDTANAGINRLLALPDGFVTFGWTMSHGAGDDDFWLQRLDSFGDVSCVGGGACIGKSPVACDDGNACTADACFATGCTHTPMADWSVCGTNQVCDGNGTCGDVTASKGMTEIPAGTFWMGCNAVKDSACGAGESPQHKVTLSGYAMDLTETTVAAYKACVDAGGCTVPAYVYPAGGSTYPDQTTHPVNYVTWTQARQFCQWRGSGFDLPTEAQWEMAARGRCEENNSAASDPACASAMRTWPWGEASADCTRAVMSFGGAGCGTSATFAVGSKPAGDSPFGLHDMAGNVFEWVRDWSDTYPSAAQGDPTGPATGSIRVDRGGSFQHDATLQRTAFRSGSAPDSSYLSLGFRCTHTF